jgi:hypothetical protein
VAIKVKKISKEYIEAQIVKEHYYVVPDTTLTFCALVCKNKVVGTGQAGTASMTEFDIEDSRRRAREKAMAELWQAYGIILKNKIYEDSLRDLD